MPQRNAVGGVGVGCGHYHRRNETGDGVRTTRHLCHRRSLIPLSIFSSPKQEYGFSPIFIQSGVVMGLTADCRDRTNLCVYEMSYLQYSTILRFSAASKTDILKIASAARCEVRGTIHPPWMFVLFGTKREPNRQNRIERYSRAP
jgi:hypothetical protein